jgi:hypothetical protein
MAVLIFDGLLSLAIYRPRLSAFIQRPDKLPATGITAQRAAVEIEMEREIREADVVLYSVLLANLGDILGHVPVRFNDQHPNLTGDEARFFGPSINREAKRN